MSEEKIARLREVFLETTKKFLEEQKPVENLLELSEREQWVVLITATMKIDDLLYEMCKLGISGAKLRGASSEEIERFMKELEDVSKELRESMASLSVKKALFFLSQFQLLQRRIIKSVANMLSPKPLYEFSKKEAMPIVGKNVFVVHGRDTKPVKELKAMLTEFGLNPIVLHELPSGSMTIIEKLEKYSEGVGFAFAILTPDDVGFEFNRFQSLLRTATFEHDKKRWFLEETITHELKPRTRQNVLLEFGFFMGKLNRSKVCCLYKGNVDLPSDMQGIVYIHFNNSVNEVRNKIIKELKAAGFEIKI